MHNTSCYKINMDNDFIFNTVVEYLFSRIKGISQKKVAETIGLKQPEVSMIKTGERRGTLDQRAKIRSFFGLTENEVETLGNAIQAGIDPIGLPKVSLNQTRMLLKSFFIESGMDNKYTTITFDQESNNPLLYEKVANKQSPTNDLERYALTKHQKRTGDFKQKGLAFDINDKLVEIEKSEPGYLIDLNDILEKKLNRLKRKAASTGALGESQKEG